MPTQQDVQTTIVSATSKFSSLVYTDLQSLYGSCKPKNQCKIYGIKINLKALSYQDEIQDYTSDATVTIYNRLKCFIGLGGVAFNFNPNYQFPTSPIVIESKIPPPVDIQYGDMTLTGTRYDNSAWMGFNPFMQVDNATQLYLGADYTLLPTGGFVLNPSGNLPAIYAGQIIRVVTYGAVAGVVISPPDNNILPYTLPFTLES